MTRTADGVWAEASVTNKALAILALRVRPVLQFSNAIAGRPAASPCDGACMSGIPSPALETRDIATVRVRRMRAARGACWVIVIGLLTATGVALLDAAIRLPGWARGLALAVWLTGVGVLAWRLIVRAWRDEPISRPSHEARKELPGNLRAASAASLALGTCLLAAAFLPGAIDHLRRVAIPWHRPASSQYQIVVTSGDPIVRRGFTVTLTGYAKKTDSGAPALTAATLLCRDVGGTAEHRIPMTVDGNATFHITRVVTDDFVYRIEAGGGVSDWFTVAALDPADIAEGSVTEVLPPKYAPNGTKSVRPGFVALDGFQHGTAEFRLRFTRPPADAYLEFRAEGTTPELTRLVMSPDRLTGTATFRFKQDGVLRLVTVVEQDGRKLRSEDPTVSVRVKPDALPRFELVSGISPRPMAARPGERLNVAVVATDDIAVGSAVLEYALDPTDSGVVTVSVPLSGVGTARATGQVNLDLTDKARPGQTLRFRLRVLDSRRLDDLGLKPQEAVYPESGWATIRIDADAPPLEVQEILGRRDVVRASLEAALKELREEGIPAIDQVIVDVEKVDLPSDHITRLNNSRENTKRAANLLHDAARESALCQEMRPLATSLRNVADGPLKDGEDALRRAVLASPKEREGLLATSRKYLADSDRRIEELIAHNDQLARTKLDIRALTGFATEQAALAVRIAGTPPEDLIKVQQELLISLNKLLQESEALRKATDAAKQHEFQMLATNTADLTSMIHELNDAAREFQANAQELVFGSIIADQKALAASAEGVLARLDTAARLAKITPPKAEDFRRVAELVADGKNVDALVGMAQLAQALDAIATTFEKHATDRLDSKVAARQLALWQDDLRNRFRVATAANPGNFATLPAATRASFRTEQAAIRSATGALRVSPGAGAAARDTAVEHLTGVSNFLNATGANVDVAMKIAIDQLNMLAEKLPTIPERLAKTRSEFDKLLREQESIVVGVEQVFRLSDPTAFQKKLAPFAARQQQQVAAFTALDLPGFDPRRVRMLAALTAATTDLHSAVILDVPVSQAWAKREFERFRSTLFDNTAPADEKADELARRMEDVVKALQSMGATPTIAANVQDILKQLGKLTRTPEAPALLYDAGASMQTADLAFRNSNTKPAELLRKVQTAAEDLARLSDRLNSIESDLDRVRRLSANRRLAAIRAKEIPPNSQVNPEVGRELARELDELTLTRVGFVAQMQKKRILDEYARLRDKPAADRQAEAHANLATGLDELAAFMADIDDLCATVERAPSPTETSEADGFLPSRTLADALRDLARRHRTARERIINLPAELRKWTKPANTNPLAEIEKEQRKLGTDVSKLVESLSTQSVRFPADPNFAESETLLAANHLRNGSVREAKENGARAMRLLRKLAESPLARGAGELANRQERLLRELSSAAAIPGVVAARQRARVQELASSATELLRRLEAAARDAGLEGTAGKTLAEAAIATSAARKLLIDADDKLVAGKAEEAATLREEAEAQFREIAAKTAGTGPAPTTLPPLDPNTAEIGETLRRSELAMRQAIRDLEGKPDQSSVAKAMQTAAEGMSKIAKAMRERLQNEGK